MDRPKALAIAALLSLCHPAVSAPKANPLLSRQDASFCEGNGQHWDEVLWNDNDMGEFVNNRIAYWAGAGGDWLSEDSIPEHFAEFNGDGDHDKMWNWSPECTNVDLTCDLSDNKIAGVDGCGDNWRRAFTLWSMRNLARFLQTYYARATDAFDTAAMGFADMSTKFIVSDDADMPHSSWTSIAGAVLSTVGAMVPGMGAVAGGASGAFYIASGTLAASPPEDPRFTTFKDMMNNAKRGKESVQDSIAAYFNRLMRDRPGSGDHNAATEISELLMDGLWANQDTGLDSSGEGDERTVRKMVRSINSGFITEAWNADKWYLVTWKKGLLRERFGKTPYSEGWFLDPCEHDISGITDQTLCHKGRNWAFHRIGPESPYTGGNTIWPEGGGFNPDDLESVDFSRGDVIDVSQARADANPDVWVDRDYKTIDKMMEKLSREDEGDDGWTALMFNLPICILDNLPDIEVDQRACPEWEAKCLSAVIRENCKKHKLNNGESWPYPPE